MSELEKLARESAEAALAVDVDNPADWPLEYLRGEERAAKIADPILSALRKAQAMALRKACEEFSSRYSYSGDMVIDELMMLVDELENDDG